MCHPLLARLRNRDGNGSRLGRELSLQKDRARREGKARELKHVALEKPSEAVELASGSARRSHPMSRVLKVTASASAQLWQRQQEPLKRRAWRAWIRDWRGDLRAESGRSLRRAKRTDRSSSTTREALDSATH